MRDDCFAGERLLDLEHARARARAWCAEEAPREHFDSDERTHLLPVPSEPYDVATWSEPKVGIDQHAQVARGLYSLPFEYRGKHVRARVDRSTVRFYDITTRALIKTRARVAPGKRSRDPTDFPEGKMIYAARDAQALVNARTATVRRSASSRRGCSRARHCRGHASVSSTCSGYALQAGTEGEDS